LDEKTSWIDGSRGHDGVVEPGEGSELRVSLRFEPHLSVRTQRHNTTALRLQRAANAAQQDHDATLASVVHVAQRSSRLTDEDYRVAEKEGLKVADEEGALERVSEITQGVKSAICLSRRRMLGAICCCLLIGFLVAGVLSVALGSDSEPEEDTRAVELVARREASVSRAAESAASSIGLRGHFDAKDSPDLASTLEMFGVKTGQLPATVTGPTRAISVGQAFGEFQFPTEAASPSGRRRMEQLATLAHAVPVRTSLGGRNFSGELIMFASDLVSGNPVASDLTDVALRLNAEDLDLSTLPVFQDQPKTWLGGFRLPTGMGSILATSQELVVGSERLLEQGLNFGGFLQEAGANSVAPFITSLNNQAESAASSDQLFQYIRGSFPLASFESGKEGGSSVSSLQDGTVEIRLIDTDLDAGWIGFEDSTLHISEGRLLLSGLGESADTVTNMSCAFAAEISGGNKLAGVANGIYSSTGAFSAHGSLTTVELPAIAGFIKFEHVEIDVAFVSQETAVVMDHIMATTVFTLPKLGNARVTAAGLIQGDRWGWSTHSSVPGTWDLATLLCKVDADLCGQDELAEVRFSNIRISLSVATLPVVLPLFGVVPQGITLRVDSDVTLPADVMAVLSMLGVEAVQAVVAANVPFPPVPACEASLSFGLEGTHPGADQEDGTHGRGTAIMCSTPPHSALLCMEYA
jgi:hypothetical protein